IPSQEVPRQAMDTNPIHVQAIAEQVVGQGAVITIPGMPIRRDLVGCLRWINDSQIMWFVAHGDSDRDAFALTFDEVRIVKNLGIGFIKGGVLRGYLTKISEAQVEDPDDYRIGWQIWKEVAPLHGAVIERAFAR